ncbi:MAG: response regulator [Thermodesulfovibrio sp.]|nr:response regulator [Thermodesulfovibrio sp.]
MFEEISKVLVVDDEIINLELISASFYDTPNIIIYTAKDGLEALEVIEKQTPDLIVLDIIMPRMDGIQLIDILKSDFSTSQIPIIVLSANERERKNALKKGANDFLSKPFDIEELKIRVMNNLKVKKYNDLIRDINEILQKEVENKTKQLRQAYELAKEAEYEMVVKLGMVSEFRDEETGQHAKRISLYAKLFAQLIGLSEEEQSLLYYAAPLHDVGKIGIPDSILKKIGPLTPEEFEIIKLHTIIGGKILDSDPRFTTLVVGKIIAEQHHEKWDGSGYPKGLKGEDIHIFGRIVAVCDVFDALTSPRVYRPAFSVDEAIEIVKSGRKIHFDPLLVDIFVNNIEEFLKIRNSLRD